MSSQQIVVCCCILLLRATIPSALSANRDSGDCLIRACDNYRPATSHCTGNRDLCQLETAALAEAIECLKLDTDFDVDANIYLYSWQTNWSNACEQITHCAEYKYKTCQGYDEVIMRQRSCGDCKDEIVPL